VNQYLHKSYRFLHKNWNSLLAGVSVVGYLVFSLVPSLQTYSKWFAFLGVNAIIWTLIELKISMDRDSPHTRYKDMRVARPDILSCIRKSVSRNRQDLLEIRIIGGRIRTISDMLREIKNEIVTHQLRARNIKFIVYCVDPNFVETWKFSGMKNQRGFEARTKSYAGLVRQFSDELEEYNSLEIFTNNNVSIDIVHYRCFPSLYTYIIGKSSIFWGFFTWNAESEDFEGPSNPCFFLNRHSDFYDDYYKWLVNRTEFLNLSKNCTEEVTI
jgi:hypothetical protein